MNYRTALKTLALAAVAALALPALAAKPASPPAAKPTAGPTTPAASPTATVPGCAFGDLTGVTVTGCSGFFSGNLLKGGTGDLVSGTIATELAALGVANASAATYLEKLASNNGAFAIDFSLPLAGVTVIGLHVGGGSDKFGSSVPGGATAFYRFDAGTTGLDSFGLASYMTASSGVAIFQTAAPTLVTAPAAVPEPGSYTLALAGLAALALVARRRRRA